ncbi:MAG: IMP dehydrogenase [Patescibacteria group bacterium]
MPGHPLPLGLTYDDVLLEPRKSGVNRNEVDLGAQLTTKVRLGIPILASAMDTVSEVKMAVALGRLGGMAVLHRSCSIAEQVAMAEKVKREKLLCGAAVGPHDMERARKLDRARVDVIFIDVAHAYMTHVLRDARKMKRAIRAQLVVGNIATREAALELATFADAIKVGVGPGSICITRIVTGVGVPQLTALQNVVAAVKSKVPVIADGGIKYSGDIVKALAAGASSVMLGSMLSGTAEAPGKIITIRGKKYKSYRGMGSIGVMEKRKSADRYSQRGAERFVPEGVEGIVPFKGPVGDIVWHMVGGVRSGMGYLGANAIADLPKRARFIQLTSASLRESHPHTVTISKKAPNY